MHQVYMLYMLSGRTCRNRYVPSKTGGVACLLSMQQYNRPGRLLLEEYIGTYVDSQGLLGSSARLAELTACEELSFPGQPCHVASRGSIARMHGVDVVRIMPAIPLYVCIHVYHHRSAICNKSINAMLTLSWSRNTLEKNNAKTAGKGRENKYSYVPPV